MPSISSSSSSSSIKSLFSQGLITVSPADFYVEEKLASCSSRRLILVSQKQYLSWKNTQSEYVQACLLVLNGQTEHVTAGQVFLIPENSEKNYLFYAVVIYQEVALEALAAAYDRLPVGDYVVEYLDPLFEKNYGFQVFLGWGLQAYRFERYKKREAKKNIKPDRRILIRDSVVLAELIAHCEAHYLIRDLINTPADHLGPSELALVSQKMADIIGAEYEVIEGPVLEKEFPSIHAVGRASDDPPRLILLRWGKNKNQPTVSLLGKGVCFDTGGLDLKNSDGMRWMKKDMGGAAHVLGLVYLIAYFNLKVNLEIYIPAVENAVGGNAYRPGDVILTRKTLTVEIGNTDAEGRVILSDALCFASEQKENRNMPDLMIDFATLTGAARVALGAELPALFSNQDEIAKNILIQGKKWEDPLWQLPLYQPYKAYLKSSIADLNNMSKLPYGGAITAALFLENFVGEVETPSSGESKKIDWCHIDLMGFNLANRPAHPEGGEAMGLRAVFYFLKDVFLNK